MAVRNREGSNKMVTRKNTCLSGSKKQRKKSRGTESSGHGRWSLFALSGGLKEMRKWKARSG